ncbi:MAG TPA: flagellar biosynthetic protein FliO [Planctomycetota bacterium]|nr:flagellar biosynthetic protein FliO [Planctomycetota bacterium]
MLTLAILAAEGRTNAGPDMTQYLAVCVGLIVLVAFGGYAFKRFFAKSITARAARRSLQILDVLPLGGKQRLAVVRCYDRTFVVGLGDKEMCLVSELDTQATPELAPKIKDPLPEFADQSAFQRLLCAVRPKPPRGAGLAREGVLG